MRHQDGATSEHLDARVRLRDSSDVMHEPSRADDVLVTIPSAVFVFGANGRIEDVNARAEALVGYSRGQLIGHGIDLVLSYATRSTASARRVQFLPAADEVFAHHRNGRGIPVEVLLCPHGHGSTMAIVHATSELDPGALRAEAIEHIVHDLRNSLGALALDAELLCEMAAVGVDIDIRRALARIGLNSEFIVRLVQDLVDASSIANRRFEIHRYPTELRTLIEQVVERTVPMRDRLRVVLDTPCSLMLSIDAMRIERVVANLLHNALKYAPRGSRIVLRLDVEPDHGQVSVTDTGAGMTPAETTYVFDKYRRTPSACTYEGSGLGLYICKQIVEAHGGTIGVDSVIDAGSRFFFILPRT
jgi:two-component system phosphate regulon sensor histidine kinase PhoR